MNSKRSMWKLLVGVAGVGFLVTNCTIKSATDDDTAGAGNTTSGSCSPVGKKVSGCTCPGNNSVSYQLCTAEGIYGDCVCTATGSGGSSSGGSSSGGSSSGGKSSSAGYGGSVTADAGASPAAAGDAGAGGAGDVIDPTDCYGCLDQKCAPEWSDCVAEDEKNPETPGNYCLSSTGDGSGQIEAVLDCIENERMNGLVKRDVVRACGSSLGQSTDPSFFQWPPTDMTAVTTQVLNCMADATDEVTKPGRWADDTNIPPSGSPKPWLDGTCAKLACTSATPKP